MKKIILLFILLLLLPLAPSVLAADIEVYYPPVGPKGIVPTFGDGPAQWIEYLFYFGLIITGIAAVGSLIYAGIIWMTSGVTDKIADAKSRIWAAILGIIIVASSVLLLRTINPDFIKFSNPTLEDVYEGISGSSTCDDSQYFNTGTFACEDKLTENANCTFDRQCQEGLYCNRWGQDECKPILGKDCNTDSECINTNMFYCDQDDRCAQKETEGGGVVGDAIWLNTASVDGFCEDVPGDIDWRNAPSNSPCRGMTRPSPEGDYSCCIR